MAGDPGIESGGRLFEQREIFDPGGARGFDCELARFFVETGGNREHDLLAGKRRMLRVVPSFAEMGEIASGSLDGREDAAFFLRIPGQNFRGAICFRIREPRFGGVNGFGGEQARLGRARMRRLPAGRSDTGMTGACAKPRCDCVKLLRDREDVDGREIGFSGFLRIDIGEGRVRGA